MNSESNYPSLGQPNAALALRDHTQIAHSYGYKETSADNDDDDEIDLRDLWQVIVRRKWLILSIATLVFILALVITFMMTPTYRASTSLQIDQENQNFLKYDIQAQTQAVATKDFYSTQYELLKSHTLANRVIEQLGLESALKGDQLAKPFFTEQLDKLKASFASDPILETTENGEQTQSEQPLTVLGEMPLSVRLLAKISVAPVKNSQIVTIYYDDSNPQRASDVANSIADNFIEMNLERRRNAAQYAEKALKEELILAQGRLLESEAKLNDYAKEKGIIATDDKESLTSQKMRELNQALTQAENDRVKAQSEYEQASKSRPQPYKTQPSKR